MAVTRIFLISHLKVGLKNNKQLGDISKSDTIAFNRVTHVRKPKYCTGLKLENEKTMNPKAAEREVNKAVFTTPCKVARMAFAWSPLIDNSFLNR